MVLNDADNDDYFIKINTLTFTKRFGRDQFCEI